MLLRHERLHPGSGGGLKLHLQLDRLDGERDRQYTAEIEERKSQLKAGIKPVYISKSKQKEKDLVKKYEKLKQSGGLDSYIKKKTKKNVAKDRKRFENL